MTAKSTWQPHSVYLYLICLITLIMCIVATVNGVRAALEIAYPQAPMAEYAIPVKAPGEEAARPTEAQMAAEQEWQLRSSRRYAVINLVGNATMVAIALPLYLYHWGKIRKLRAAESAAA